MQTRGFLFGHYDSRGGTSFIVADTKEKACSFYLKHFFCCEDDEIAEFVIQEDFIGEVSLDFNGHEFKSGTDIEAEGCKVIALNCEDEEDYVPGGHPLMVISQESPMPSGSYHPDWDDDAYCFIYLTA